MLALALASVVALPWLHGFAPATIADRGSTMVIARLSQWHAADEACVANAYGGLELEADVAPSDGVETVLASFAQGVVVLDREHQLVARADGFACEGSADELLSIAAGDAGIGAPVIALAATAGGHAESVTWVTLYRVGARRQLVATFTAAVEVRAGDDTRTGVVTIVPGGLIYRSPFGTISVWTYDRDAGRYAEHGAVTSG